ncbi:MAG: glycoside hydrolase family 88 protein [Muribaculaceae bacterium]|nr:glycoside hydrolase family 88 protein [Muribaculaceae bacterium]
MKKTALLIVACLLGLASYAQGMISPKVAWDSIYPAVESQIKAPEFRDKDYRLLDYGKVSKTPGYLYTELINKVIDRCSSEGGGRVIIPKGTWFTGPITLKSNVNLHLEEGATLLFTSDLKEYPLVYTRWEGMDCYNYQPMLYAIEQENIAITGKGVIDGGASNDNWWRMCGATHYGYEFNKGIVSQRIGRPILMEWNEKGVPLEDRKMGDGYGMRVQLVNPVKCKNVLIEGVTLLRSPFWVIHPLFCENLTVKNVHIQNDGPNGDGCDPESCKNVLIEGCFFDTGDDCIAIKSGRNRDGRLAATPTENVIVRNCQMKNGHGGVVVGSEISGGFKNLFVENCVMDSPELERVIRIKTNSCRGGIIEDIFVRNVQVGRCKEAVLKINLVYEKKEQCERAYPPTVRNVILENVTCKESKYGVMMEGFDDICNIYNIEVKDCDFSGVKTDGNSIKGLTRDIIFDNLTINGRPCLESQPLSLRMSLSELKRWPLSWQADHSKRPKWSYSVGVDMEALMAVARKYDHSAIRDYAISYLDTLVTPEGEILTYKASDYKLDDIKNGTLLLEAHDINKDPRLLTAAASLYNQLTTQPKTKDGGYWHKRIYPNQMWLDGLYMAQPFLTSYAGKHLEGKAQEEAYDEVARQFLTVAKHTYDPATGLYRHAWNETKDMFWADKDNGQSSHCWGRAQGWFFWALTDVLEKFPTDHPQRPELIKLLGSIADGIVKYQDPQTGVWYQVVDESGRSKNYRESTASAMFCYNLLRAVRLGFLPDSYREAGVKAYNGILNNFITTNTDGTLTLTDCCAVAGLGGGSSERRNGSFEYYISEPKRPNDAKGVGPFILASLEMEDLK